MYRYTYIVICRLIRIISKLKLIYEFNKEKEHNDARDIKHNFNTSIFK